MPYPVGMMDHPPSTSTYYLKAYHHSAVVWCFLILTMQHMKCRKLQFVDWKQKLNFTPWFSINDSRASPTMTSISGEGSSEQFSLFLLNACSKPRKFRHIRLLVLSSNFDFIQMAETWLSDHTPDDAQAIPCYKFFSNITATGWLPSPLQRIITRSCGIPSKMPFGSDVR